MARIQRTTKTVLMVITVLLGSLLFVPPARNMLTLGLLPRVWRDYSTFTILKARFYSVRNPMTALSPCTIPREELSKKAGGSLDSLQQLLISEPFQKTPTRLRDVVAHSKALAWLGNQTKDRARQFSRFAPKLSPREKTQLVLTWRVLHEVLTLNNVSHYLIDGSLLGAARHGGVIPWDDEMDIAVDERDADTARRVLSCVPRYVLRVMLGGQWKFFPEDGLVIKKLSRSPERQVAVLSEEEKESYVLEDHVRPHDDVIVRAPFMDIFLMTTDGSHVWCLTAFNQVNSFYPAEDVYPLAEMDFEGHPAPVPRNSLSLAKREFDANVCVSSANDHATGEAIEDVTAVPCAQLKGMYTVYTV